ncbi:MAG: hypothetical protein CMA60_05695 [Euryarchaeota archaeon]|nr:hypothetical protein [Euryarchaeota archaeon]|tara:strand:+ start:21552 stop:21962 length:411 start_codon:yes stop_codon:yes gene_type:complete
MRFNMAKNRYDFMKSGEVPPFPKKFVERAEKIGQVKVISISFSGGSDEGYISAHATPYYIKGMTEEAKVMRLESLRALDKDVEEWAYEKMSFSGAGPPDYGGSIDYNLEKGTVEIERWTMVCSTEDDRTIDLEVDE